MNCLEEIFLNKPQELVSTKLYYRLGELDYKQMKSLLENCPELHQVLENSFRVGEQAGSVSYLVPVDLVMQTRNSTDQQSAP